MVAPYQLVIRSQSSRLLSLFLIFITYNPGKGATFHLCCSQQEMN